MDGEHGFGFGKGAQVIKVAVLSIGKMSIPAARTLGRRGYYGNAFFAHHGHQITSSSGKFLAIYHGFYVLSVYACLTPTSALPVPPESGSRRRGQIRSAQ